MTEPRVIASVLPIFEGGRLTDAFHGTTGGNASAIMAQRRFDVPAGVCREYGVGVYFFEGDYKAAAWWARKRVWEQGSDSPAVIRAEVQLGRTLYANVMAPEVERIREQVSAVLGRAVTKAQAWQLFTAALQRAGLIDAIKVARRANKRDLPPDSEYRFEMVICVFDPQKATPLEQCSQHDLKKTVKVAVL